MVASWYQVGDECRKLTLAEVHRPENAGAVLIVCPQCVYELERGEAAPGDHECADGLDLTFRVPTKEDLERLESPEPAQCELVLHHFLHGTLKETGK
jgi:hypothetical protein